MEQPITEPIIVPTVNGIKISFLISLKKIIVLPRLEPIWTIPCNDNNATGGSLTASNPSKIARPPIPNAEVINEVAILAKIKKMQLGLKSIQETITFYFFRAWGGGAK